MNCPVCQVALVVVEREGIELDWCPDCRGLWFDEGELELLGEKAGRKLATEDLGGRPGDAVGRGSRRCPRCRGRMERLDLEAGANVHVQIDRCPEHGIWLDQGELGTILRRRTAGRDTDEETMFGFLGETFATNAERDEERGR